MFMFWLRLSLGALEHSFQTIGKEPSDVIVSIAVFLIIGFLLIRRKGWPKGWTEVKDRLPRVLGEDFGIVLCVFISILIFHIARDSYREWKIAEDRTHQLEQEKQSIANELAQEKDKSQPKFELGCGTSIIGDDVIVRGSLKQHDTHVFLPVTVINHGAPSVVTGISLIAKTGDGKYLEGSAFIPSQRELIFHMPHGETLRFLTASSLAARGTERPIPTGGQADGYVFFLFSADAKPKLIDSKTVLVLEIRDINKHVYRADIPMNGPKATHLSTSPGLLSIY